MIIDDAPWIKDAMINGVPDEMSEEERYSLTKQTEFLKQLDEVENALKTALDCISGLDDGTIWEKALTELYEQVTDCNYSVKVLEEEVNRL